MVQSVIVFWIQCICGDRIHYIRSASSKKCYVVQVLVNVSTYRMNNPALPLLLLFFDVAGLIRDLQSSSDRPRADKFVKSIHKQSNKIERNAAYEYSVAIANIVLNLISIDNNVVGEKDSDGRCRVQHTHKNFSVHQI